MTAARGWALARVGGGIAVLAVIVWRLGAGPILDGLRSVSASSLIVAAAIAGVTTVAAAWRWSLVARGLGVPISLPKAVAASYRAQFLNVALPGGVLGDVHRGVRHGRDAGDVSRGLRAVMWERAAGQAVQVGLAFAVFCLFASPIRPAAGVLAVVLAALVAAAALLMLGFRRSKIVRGACRDVRDGVLARSSWPGVALASAVAVVGHATMFVVAARTAGVDVSTTRLLPLAMIVLLAMAVPTNVAGWGPREGVAAWAFGSAGLGAAHGVTTAAVYGVMVFVASSPGAVAVIVEWRRRRLARRVESVSEPRERVEVVHA